MLETTFRTKTGVVRVTDAMTLPGRELSPQREVVRAVEGLVGSVAMGWNLVPRFGFGPGLPASDSGGSVPVASRGADAMALCIGGQARRSWGPGRSAGASMSPLGSGRFSL